MRIAAAINNDDENFFWHFGHCERFKLYDVADGAVTGTNFTTVTGGHGPQRLQAMIDNDVDVVLSDGMGPGIADAAPQYGITTIAGVTGDADAAVAAYLAGNLKNDPAGVHPCGMDEHEGK